MLDGVAAQAVGDGEQPAARLRGIFVAWQGLAGPGRGGCHREQRRHYCVWFFGFMACHE